MAYSECSLNYIKRFKMTIIAKLDFIQLSGAAKLVFCRNIQSKLANTQIFTTPDIPIATITTLIDEYEKALINSKDGSHTATHILSDVEKRLDDMFHLLVYYVNKVAKGNETIIIQSGFNPSQPPTPRQKAEIAVKDGANSGVVIVDIKSVEHAVAYNYVYKKELADKYSDPETSTYTQHTFTGLTPATSLYFSFSAISKDGVSDYCDPILKLIL